MQKVVLHIFGLALMAIASHSAPRLPLESYTLDNGMRIILHEDHSTPMVAAVTLFRVGSKDELPGKTGFAHLFEHLMFKGSANLPDGLMDRILEEGGGWSNAFTTQDHTVYQNMAAANFLEAMLWMDGDRYARLLEVFDLPKLDNQRDVVRNERRQGVDNVPYGQAPIIAQEMLWPKDHGYHWDTIGYHEDLQAASVDDVKAFYRKYYVPNNATMVIAGDFDPKAARAWVQKYIAWIPRAAEPNRPKYSRPKPIPEEGRVVKTDKVQVPRVYLEWRAPASFSADEPALDLAAHILARGKTSRLYKRLVYDDKIAQDVRAFNNSAEIGGQFEIVATAKPGVAPEKLIAAISEELKRFDESAPSPAELEQAQNSREAGFLTGLESSLQRAIVIAFYDALAGNPNYLEQDLARYRNVTLRDVQGAVKNWLKPNARIVMIFNPEEAK